MDVENIVNAYLLEVGDGRECKSQKAILRRGLELVRQGGDRGEVLVFDSDTSDSHCRSGLAYDVEHVNFDTNHLPVSV